MSYNVPSQDNSGDLGDANLAINKVNLGNNIASVSVGGDIQTALDYLNSIGGGVLSLKAGTYDVTNNLVVYSNIRIEGVGSNATIIDFGGGAYQIQMIGSSGAHLNSIFMDGLTVQNSSTDLIKASYVDTFEVFDVQCYLGASGFNLDHITQNSLENIIVAECVSGIIGVSIDNFADRNIVISGISGGHGLDFNRVTNGVILVMHIDDVTGNGGNFVFCDDFTLNMYTVNSCSGIGISITTNTTSIGLNNGNNNGNTLDGIKLAGTNAVQIATCISSSNGRNGINISNSQCVNTQIVGNIVTTNVAAAVNNSGTYTLIRSNIGVADN